MALSRHTKILLYGANIWFLGEGMLGPLFAVFSQRVGGNIFDMTIAWAAYLVVTGALNIFIGGISDSRFKKETLMIIGYGVNAIFTFGYILVQTPFDLFLVQIGLGVANALANPTWNALYSDYSKGERSGFIWGMARGQSEIITALAVLIGGLIVSYFSFTVLFITMGVIQIIATIYQARILKD